MNNIITSLLFAGAITWTPCNVYCSDDPYAEAKPAAHVGPAPSPVPVPPAVPGDLAVMHPVLIQRMSDDGEFWTVLTNRVDILWCEREERMARREAIRRRAEANRNRPPEKPFRIKTPQTKTGGRK